MRSIAYISVKSHNSHGPGLNVSMQPTPQVIDWLMQGDPAIRWQTMRDLLGSPGSEVEKERARVADEGWGRAYRDCMTSDGTWPDGRWTGMPWVAIILMDCGMPAELPDVLAAVQRFLDSNLSRPDLQSTRDFHKNMDLCHVGFWLRLGAYFTPQDQRLSVLIDTLAESQMADGGWNCQIRTKVTNHSSFHTTFNALEGLREASIRGVMDAKVFRDMEQKALEFMLAHRMYKSDKTGEVVAPVMTYLTFPSHWHYTVLRGLDYLRLTPEIKDPRARDALDLIRSQMHPSETWKVEKPVVGVHKVVMEKNGSQSRWNTLRALRVLAAVDRP